ncbi:DUF2851 family protein [Maribacter sp. CXY002]|uniref:DUF2851 family protein n=1 Tax=Maribacter luteocoastalis TaxID=3407671 RepID=UPI003B67E62F
MREEFLHYIWKFRKFPVSNLQTTEGEPILIENVGSHNLLSGPDFFNARLQVGEQIWAGNVEIHIYASDWYTHNHQDDPKYDSIILHVVWEDDVSIYRKDCSVIPTLQLKDYINSELFNSYQKLFDERKNKFISCEADIASIPSFTINNWLERLYFERLENKSNLILDLLQQSNNDWEKVLFILLLKNFGSKINGNLFFEIGKSIDFKIIRQLYNKEDELEALFFGSAGLLKSEKAVDPFYANQKQNYNFLAHKYTLKPVIGNGAEFFKLRPLNFPTIRLSQVAQLYASNNNLFQTVMSASVAELYQFLKVTTGVYWETHYTFGKKSTTSVKSTSKKFIDLLIINTILPLKFCYLKYKGEPFNEHIINTIVQITNEENNIIGNYRDLGVSVTNARDSQAVLELYANYCKKNKCLQCAVGTSLLNLKP